MTASTGTGKYEQVLERCRNLPPVPTAVAHPCEETALAGAIEAGEKGLISPILVGPASKIQEIAQKAGIALGSARIVDVAAQPRVGGQSRRARAQGRGRAVDERKPAHRRASRRGRCPRNRAAHRTPHQPRVHHGRADVSQGPHRHRRGHQHLRRSSRTRPTSVRTRSTWRSRLASSSPRWRYSPRSRRSPRR